MADEVISIEQYEQLLTELVTGQPSMELHLDTLTMFSLAAQLQLALRHPGNKGVGAARARVFIDNFYRAIESKSPQLAAFFRLGDNPAHDVVAADAVATILVTQQDQVLFPWILGIHSGRPSEPGKFLRHLAEAAMRADPENYFLLRPVLTALAKKYPTYQDKGTWAEMDGGGWKCRVCGCTEVDCSGCVARTGETCHWVEKDLCSACVPAGGPG